MAKRGEQRKYSGEFKIGVIMDMREHRLGYRETARKYWDVSGGQEINYVNAVKRWERIFLEEGAAGLMKERRGNARGTRGAQVKHESDILQKGSAFQLVKAFLQLNKLQEKRLVEVIVMSRNSPNTSLRIFNSIQDYELDITRAALTGGSEIAPYLRAFKTDLFLSAFEPDVKQAIDSDVAAGKILTGTSHFDPRAKIDQIRIAFDGDAVLFASESERIYQHEGMQAFMENERAKADIPLQKGPFANFLLTIAHIQELFQDKGNSPIRTALVTSRNAPAHERAIKTLRKWNVHIDEAFFLGGVSKRDVLSAFGAHIFFDDQHVHADPASEVVPSAVVPYREGDNPQK